jgi:hypothetical protein
LKENKIHLSVIRGNNDKEVLSAIVYEMICQSEKSGTSVVIAPEYHPNNFEEYMKLVQYLEEEVLEEYEELRDEIQIAPFHPLFQFSGTKEQDVDNYTNRSPFPLFHILREDEVSMAVKKLGGDAAKVWERNVRLLEGMEEKFGREGVERAMGGEEVEGMDDLLREIKLPDS